MHNPEKNKALCVVAKTIFWPLRIVGWATASSLTLFTVTAFGFMAVQSIRDNWHGFTPIVRGVLGFLIVLVAIGAPLALLLWLYEWAKRYKEDC